MNMNVQLLGFFVFFFNKTSREGISSVISVLNSNAEILSLNSAADSVVCNERILLGASKF